MAVSYVGKHEKRYYEKSLSTKRRAEAIVKAEEMYFDLQNELKDGRKLFSVSSADAVAIYLEHRKIDVRTGDVRYQCDKYVAFTKWWNAKLANGETKEAYLFAEPLTEMKVELVEDIDTAERYANWRPGTGRLVSNTNERKR